jgi:nucleoside-triphosphatase
VRPLRILLEGRPGVGKTTIASRLAEFLQEREISVQGFVTRELREHGRRVGFSIRTFDGRDATLAHVDIGGPPRVGRYGVDLEAFERVALPALAEQPSRGIVLIDELGKMELASERFRDAALRLFDSPMSVVATTHVFRHRLTDSLKRRRDVERVHVTRSNRDELPEQLAERIARAGAGRVRAKGFGTDQG